MDQKFMQEAINAAQNGMNNNEGWPFGAVVVRNGQIVGRWNNKVTSSNDPTAHAEVVAIRDACKTLNTFQLDDCEIYTSCEPCPMCLWAIYRARPKAVYYGCTKEDAATIDFDDHFIYDELDKPLSARSIPMIPLMREEAKKVFTMRKDKSDRVEY